MDGASMEPQEPWLNEAAGLPVTREMRACDGEPIEDALNLARSLAERLACMTRHLSAADGLRVAQALALTLVDLLEEHAAG